VDQLVDALQGQGPAPTTIQKCHIRLSAVRKLVRNNLQKFKNSSSLVVFSNSFFEKLNFA
jgi:hypothetical protein